MPSIFIKSLKPRPVNVKGYRKEILNVLRAEGKQMRILFDKVTTNWKRTVRFRTDVSVAGLEAKVQVSTKNKRFQFLDKGTKKRWAVMSNPFVPKTSVRKLSSKAGKGHPVVKGQRAMRARGHVKPMPGIKPRKFSVEIRKKRRPIFFRNMRRAMKRAAKRTF